MHLSPRCLGEQYSESLPSASVVICFHDEAWSALLRTVHSVLDTAPKQHLQEVLLVDDLSQHGELLNLCTTIHPSIHPSLRLTCADRMPVFVSVHFSGHMKSVLSEYVSHLEGVRLIRSTKRLGVGGCRTLGATRAAGEVLVFMDSHCECQRGWLEPLLERVAQDRSYFI